MYIQLEQLDYEAIAEIIIQEGDGDGSKVEYSDLCIEITFDKEVQEHRDTDYYNGTGAWEVDSVDFTLGEVTCDGVEVKYSHKELEKTIKDLLWD